MVSQLNALYQKQAKTEHFEMMKQSWECKMAEGGSLSEHVIKLVGYAQRLSALGFMIPMTLGTDILLASRPPSYNGFIMNYKMIGLDKTIDELFAMLDILLASRPPSYNGFIMNYKMNGLDKTIDELFAILKTAEATMHKDPDHTMVVTRDTGRGTVRSIWEI
jgi:gag-polypeptide of LTR copia-type